MDVCFSFCRMAMRKLIYPGYRGWRKGNIHFGVSLLFSERGKAREYIDSVEFL